MNEFTILSNADAIAHRTAYDIAVDDAAFYSRALLWLNIAGWSAVAGYLCMLLAYGSDF